MGRWIDGLVGRWVQRAATQQTKRPQGAQQMQKQEPKGRRGSLWHPKRVIFDALGCLGGHFGHLRAPKGLHFVALGGLGGHFGHPGGRSGRTPGEKMLRADRCHVPRHKKGCQNGAPEGLFWAPFRKKKNVNDFQTRSQARFLTISGSILEPKRYNVGAQKHEK